MSIRHASYLRRDRLWLTDLRNVKTLFIPVSHERACLVRTFGVGASPTKLLEFLFIRVIPHFSVARSAQLAHKIAIFRCVITHFVGKLAKYFRNTRRVGMTTHTQKTAKGLDTVLAVVANNNKVHQTGGHVDWRRKSVNGFSFRQKLWLSLKFSHVIDSNGHTSKATSLQDS